MNPTIPKGTKEAGQGRVWFVVIAVILSLCVLANLILIYRMSAEDPSASGNRSDGVTNVVIGVVYPDIEQRPIEEQESIFATFSHFIRKLAHFTEFGLLGFLVTLLLGHLARRLPVLRLPLRMTVTAVFCLLYAISDEVHQIFSGRGPAVKDVLIDFAGALMGMLVGLALIWLLCLILRTVRRRREKRVRAA